MGKERTGRKRDTPYSRHVKDEKIKDEIDQYLSKIRKETSPPQEQQQSNSQQQNALQCTSSKAKQEDARTANNVVKRKRTRRSKRAGARRRSADEVNKITASFDSLSVTTPTAAPRPTARDKYFNVLIQNVTYRLANLYITTPVQEFMGCGVKRTAEEAEIF